MASNVTLSAAAANAAADAICTLLDGGTVNIYSGVQPATADTAITTQTLLAEMTFANPAFGSAVAGVSTAHAMTAEADAPASGTATWFRALTSGSAPVFDGSVGSSDADCILSTTSIVMHSTITITSCVLTVPSA